jgi:hypothetical protein
MGSDKNLDSHIAIQKRISWPATVMSPAILQMHGGRD